MDESDDRRLREKAALQVFAGMCSRLEPDEAVGEKLKLATSAFQLADEFVRVARHERDRAGR